MPMKNHVRFGPFSSHVDVSYMHLLPDTAFSRSIQYAVFEAIAHGAFALQLYRVPLPQA